MGCPAFRAWSTLHQNCDWATYQGWYGTFPQGPYALVFQGLDKTLNRSIKCIWIGLHPYFHLDLGKVGGRKENEIRDNHITFTINYMVQSAFIYLYQKVGLYIHT